MEKNYNRVKYGCYATNVTMAIICNLSPLLFIIFRTTYGISYTLLGLLVLINFCTQLGVDLIFSFFSHKFNVEKTLKFTPVLSIIGLAVYALIPMLLPNYAYLGLLLGTIIFAGSSGLAEVLVSPVIAEIPADDPDREMSKLHSIYAWGVVGMVAFGTLFILIFGGKNWGALSLVFITVPLIATILFSKAEIPTLPTPEKTSGAVAFLKNKGVWICVLAIFLGGASECIMAQWCSGYIEKSLGLPKVYGDIFGMMLFSVALGFGRTLYSKIGKNVYKVIFAGAIGAFVCYLTASLVGVPVIGLIACAVTGFCVSMMWPGSLIVSTEKFPNGGVLIFALMASGGDFGASVGPQLVGIVTDATMASAWAGNLATTLGITVEQLGMKVGMLVGSIFPLLAIAVFGILLAGHKKQKNKLLND